MAISSAAGFSGGVWIFIRQLVTSVWEWCVCCVSWLPGENCTVVAAVLSSGSGKQQETW